jgi:hypothetical protein
MKNSTMTQITFFLILMLSGLNVSATSVTPISSITTQKYEVTSFDKLVIDGNFEVHLFYGLHAAVTVTTDENIQANVLIDNDANTLYIRTKENGDTDTKIILNVTVNNLEKMSFKDVYLVKSVNFLWFNNLIVDINTHGKAEFNLTAKRLSINMEGAGDIYLSGQIDELSIKNSGIGAFYTDDVKVETLNVQQTTNQNIELKLSNKKGIEVKPAQYNKTYPKA